MAKYTIEDTTLIAIADSIRAKTGGADELTPEDMPTEIEGIKTGGGTEEIENLIDQSGVLDSTDGTATEKVEQLIDKAEWENIFYEQSKKWGSHFNTMFFESSAETLPRLSYSSATTLRNFAHGAQVKSIDYYMETIECKDFQSFLEDTLNLKTIVGFYTANATNVFKCFYNSAIETIQEPFDFSKVTNAQDCFRCSNLKDVSFVEETIKTSIGFTSGYLSTESIQSIIDGLATVETAQTLTLHTDVKAKLTEEQLATITSKNWNLA